MGEGEAPVTGQRGTRQRRAVSQVLDANDDFRSAQDIHDQLRQAGDKVGLATVYRTLQAMAGTGELDVVKTDTGQAVYRRCREEGHHHHLVCRECGAAVEVTGPSFEKWADQLARDHGYADVEHRLELFGLCPACQAG